MFRAFEFGIRSGGVMILVFESSDSGFSDFGAFNFGNTTLGYLTLVFGRESIVQTFTTRCQLLCSKLKINARYLRESHLYVDWSPAKSDELIDR